MILSAFKASFWFAFFAATTLILGAAYTLWMYKRVIFGEITNTAVRSLNDISTRESTILLALAIPVLVLGVWPAPLLDMMHATIAQLVEQLSHSKLL